MRVVVRREVGLILVVAAVALLAELAVEGLQSLAGGGGGRRGEGLVSLLGLGGQLVSSSEEGIGRGELIRIILLEASWMRAAVSGYWRAVCLLIASFWVLIVGLRRPNGRHGESYGVMVELCRPNS